MYSFIEIYTVRTDWAPIRLLLSCRVLPPVPTLSKQKSFFILKLDADSDSQSLRDILFMPHSGLLCILPFSYVSLPAKRDCWHPWVVKGRKSTVFQMTTEVRSVHKISVSDYTDIHLASHLVSNVSWGLLSMELRKQKAYNILTMSGGRNHLPHVVPVCFIAQNVSFLCLSIWSLLKTMKTFNIFKMQLRAWKEDLPCGSGEDVVRTANL